MNQVYCCLTCFAKFKFERVEHRQGTCHCPECGSTDLHFILHPPVVLPFYIGVIGTRH